MPTEPLGKVVRHMYRPLGAPHVSQLTDASILVRAALADGHVVQERTLLAG
jgi:hypothetical protein